MYTTNLENNAGRFEEQFPLTHQFINYKICDGRTIQEIYDLASKICDSTSMVCNKNLVIPQKSCKKNNQVMRTYFQAMENLTQHISILLQDLSIENKRYKIIANLIEQEANEKILSANINFNKLDLQIQPIGSQSDQEDRFPFGEKKERILPDNEILQFSCLRHSLNLSLTEHRIINGISNIIGKFGIMEETIGPEAFKAISPFFLRNRGRLSQYLTEIRVARTEVEKARCLTNSIDQLVQQMASEQQFSGPVRQIFSNLEGAMNDTNIIPKSNSSCT